MIDCFEKTPFFEHIFRPENIVYDEWYVWYKTYNYNYLFQVDRRNGEVSIISLPDSYRDRPTAFRRLFKHDNKIIFLPYTAREICIYDLESGCFEVESLPKDVFTLSEKLGFMDAVLVEDDLIMFGHHPVILFFNIKTKQIRFERDFVSMIPTNIRPKFWFEPNCVIDGEVYLSISNTHRLLRITPCTRKIEMLNCGTRNDNEKIDGLFFDGENIWSIPRIINEDVLVYKWNLKSDKEIIMVLNGVKVPDLYGFSRIGITEENLYLLPARQECAYIVSRIDGKCKKLDTVPVVSFSVMEKNSDFRLNYYGSCITNDKHILTVHGWTNQLVDVDMLTGKVFTTGLRIVGDGVKSGLKKEMVKKGFLLSETGIIAENSGVYSGLNALIKTVQNKEFFNEY